MWVLQQNYTNMQVLSEITAFLGGEFVYYEQNTMISDVNKYFKTMFTTRDYLL